MPQKILIADDEPCIVHVLAIKLRNAGFDVYSACDGEEALELCLSETPDLIVTDYQMPFLTGLDVCREYRSHTGADLVPAILLTARDFDVDPQLAEEVGIRTVLAKPFSPRQVVEAIEQLLVDAPMTQNGRLAGETGMSFQ